MHHRLSRSVSIAFDSELIRSLADVNSGIGRCRIRADSRRAPPWPWHLRSYAVSLISYCNSMMYVHCTKHTSICPIKPWRTNNGFAELYDRYNSFLNWFPSHLGCKTIWMSRRNLSFLCGVIQRHIHSHLKSPWSRSWGGLHYYLPPNMSLLYLAFFLLLVSPRGVYGKPRVTGSGRSRVCYDSNNNRVPCPINKTAIIAGVVVGVGKSTPLDTKRQFWQDILQLPWFWSSPLRSFSWTDEERRCATGLPQCLFCLLRTMRRSTIQSTLPRNHLSECRNGRWTRLFLPERLIPLQVLHLLISSLRFWITVSIVRTYVRKY